MLKKDVRKIHLNGNFLLTKFTSLLRIYVIQSSEEINMKNTSAETEKILGLFWNKSKDLFVFKINMSKIPDDIIELVRRPTKREVLKLVMSIFDPFGFLSFFTITCKILLQEIWKKKLKWDEQIQIKHFVIWKQWLVGLKNISTLEIPRTNFQTKVLQPIHTSVFI